MLVAKMKIKTGPNTYIEVGQSVKGLDKADIKEFTSLGYIVDDRAVALVQQKPGLSVTRTKARAKAGKLEEPGAEGEGESEEDEGDGQQLPDDLNPALT